MRGDDGSGVPAVAVPGGPAESTDGDDGGGQTEVGLHEVAAAIGAAAESAEAVEPGVGALDDPRPADLERGRRTAVSDLTQQAAVGQGLPAGGRSRRPGTW
jgi:hypothetical protein